MSGDANSRNNRRDVKDDSGIRTTLPLESYINCIIRVDTRIDEPKPELRALTSTSTQKIGPCCFSRGRSSFLEIQMNARRWRQRTGEKILPTIGVLFM